MSNSFLRAEALAGRALKRAREKEAKMVSKQEKQIKKIESAYEEEVFLQEVEDFLYEELERGKTPEKIERELFKRGWVFKPGVSYLFTKVVGVDLRDLIAEAKRVASKRKWGKPHVRGAMKPAKTGYKSVRDYR